MGKSKIIGIGKYAPGQPINNEELKKLAKIDFDSLKIENRLGIKTRHIAKLSGVKETTADFCVHAVNEAIQKAGIQAKDIGLFIVGTDTPEYISPPTAVVLQGRIQGEEKWGGAFDINASCASFATAYDTANRILSSDPTIKYACVVGVYNMPAFIRDGDAFGYTIFADGAGAFILEKVESTSTSGYVEGQLLADGTQWNYVGIYSGGSKNPVTHERLDKGEYGLQLIQPLPGDRNVRLWPMVAEHLADKAGIKVSEVDHFIFTQINRSVIVQVMEKIGQPMEKATCIMDQYGYTGSGCLPMALYHAVESGAVKKGSKVMMIASGAGLAVGSNYFVY